MYKDREYDIIKYVLNITNSLIIKLIIKYLRSVK